MEDESNTLVSSRYNIDYPLSIGTGAVFTLGTDIKNHDL